VLALIRPDSWNFPLFVHVLGAMILVGGVLAGASALRFANGSVRMLRIGYGALLFAALPGLILMRIGAALIWHKYNSNHSFLWAVIPHPGDDPTWIKIGGTVADLGGPLLILALILGWFGVKRAEGASGDFLTKVPVVKNMTGETLLRLTMLITIVLLAGYVLAVWAMAGKPS
jgi:hypothetical protein